MGRRIEIDPARIDTALFWSRVEKVPGGCWLWKGARNKRGYGRFGKPSKLAHRVAYALDSGEDPGEADVCHSCDVSGCVNPVCLFLGTPASNKADCVAKGRQANGFHLPQTVLSAADVEAIRDAYRGRGRGPTQREIAVRFGVGRGQVSKILCGTRRGGSGRGAVNEPRPPLAAYLRPEVARRRLAGERVMDLCAEYGISSETVRRICKEYA